MRLVVWLLCLLTTAPAAAEPLSAQQILERALTVAERAIEDKLELRYRWRHVNLTRRPNESTQKIFRVRPVDGEPFYELVEINGRPASEEDLEREATLRERFRSRVGGRRGIVFDRELMSRYRVELEGLRMLNGRQNWALSFEPVEQAPPVRRSVDHALNHSGGLLWIDAEDFGVARIDFALREPVKVWAGVLGELHSFEGAFQQERVEPGGWLPASLELSMEGRALFSSLDRVVDLEWSGYRPASGDLARSGYDRGRKEPKP